MIPDIPTLDELAEWASDVARLSEDWRTSLDALAAARTLAQKVIAYADHMHRLQAPALAAFGAIRDAHVVEDEDAS